MDIELHRDGALNTIRPPMLLSLAVDHRYVRLCLCSQPRGCGFANAAAAGPVRHLPSQEPMCRRRGASAWKTDTRRKYLSRALRLLNYVRWEGSGSPG